MPLFDLHSPQGFPIIWRMAGSKHLRAQELLCKEISRLGAQTLYWAVPMRDAQSGLRPCQPDGCTLRLCCCCRRDDGHTEVMALNARVEGRTVGVFYGRYDSQRWDPYRHVKPSSGRGAQRLFSRLPPMWGFHGRKSDRIVETGL